MQVIYIDCREYYFTGIISTTLHACHNTSTKLNKNKNVIKLSPYKWACKDVWFIKSALRNGKFSYHDSSNLHVFAFGQNFG